MPTSTIGPGQDFASANAWSSSVADDPIEAVAGNINVAFEDTTTLGFYFTNANLVQVTLRTMTPYKWQTQVGSGAFEGNLQAGAWRSAQITGLNSGATRKVRILDVEFATGTVVPIRLGHWVDPGPQEWEIVNCLVHDSAACSFEYINCGAKFINCFHFRPNGIADKLFVASGGGTAGPDGPKHVEYYNLTIDMVREDSTASAVISRSTGTFTFSGCIISTRNGVLIASNSTLGTRNVFASETGVVDDGYTFGTEKLSQQDIADWLEDTATGTYDCHLKLLNGLDTGDMSALNFGLDAFNNARPGVGFYNDPGAHQISTDELPAGMRAILLQNGLFVGMRP